jgi:DNA-binding response OmpR family regulator
MSLARVSEGSAKRRIVVIDDSLTILASVRRALEQRGFAVQTASDPAELATGDVQQAALVVVDVQMEQVFGDDVVRIMREVWEVTAPILLYSSLPITELTVRAQASGATGAVCKANGVGALCEQVEKALEAQ